MSSDPSEEPWTRRLLDVGRELVTELDLDALLDRVLQTAREITGARYAALGILNEQRTELEQFLTSGVGEERRRAIGDLPRGRGVLGALIEDPRPLRLANPAASFTASHPSAPARQSSCSRLQRQQASCDMGVHSTRPHRTMRAGIPCFRR
jgi:GAF domain-containing protein